MRDQDVRKSEVCLLLPKLIRLFAKVIPLVLSGSESWVSIATERRSLEVLSRNMRDSKEFDGLNGTEHSKVVRTHRENG